MDRLHAAHNALEVEFWLGQVSGLAPIAGSPLKSAFDDPNIRSIDDPNKQTKQDTLQLSSSAYLSTGLLIYYSILQVLRITPVDSGWNSGDENTKKIQTLHSIRHFDSYLVCKAPHSIYPSTALRWRSDDCDSTTEP